MKCCSRNEKNNTVFHLRIKGGGGRGSLKEEGTLYLSFPEKGGGGGGGGGGGCLLEGLRNLFIQKNGH